MAPLVGYLGCMDVCIYIRGTRAITESTGQVALKIGFLSIASFFFNIFTRRKLRLDQDTRFGFVWLILIHLNMNTISYRGGKNVDDEIRSWS